jgi:hypothetical protein
VLCKECTGSMGTHITIMRSYASARHATVTITAPVHTAPRCACLVTPAFASVLVVLALGADDGLLVLEWNGLTSVAVTLSMPVNEYRGAGAVPGAGTVVSALQRYASVRMEKCLGLRMEAHEWSPPDCASAIRDEARRGRSVVGRIVGDGMR